MHIVKLSAFGASDHSKAPICLWHHQIEKEMQRSGTDWTILRPHHFMQNPLGQTAYIVNDGVASSASGDGKIPYIDARDIAACLLKRQLEPRFPGVGSFPDPGDIHLVMKASGIFLPCAVLFLRRR